MSAFLLACLVALQDPPAAKVVEEMQARVASFKDIDLRYSARLSMEEELELGGETRLRLVPGTGLRTDGAILSMRGRGPALDLEIEATSVEMGDDLYFWAVAPSGQEEIFRILPPAVSFRGSKKDHPATLDVFPSDFSFRWVFEDLLTLYSVAPREAFARDGSLRSLGRQTVDGKTFIVLEVPVPRPADSLLGVYPVGEPLKRYFVDPETWRLERMEVEFTVEGRQAAYVRWEVRSRKDVGGVAVPEQVEAWAGTRQATGRDREELALRKKLVAATLNRGIAAGELLPEERRKDLHAEGTLRPVDFYTKSIERDPAAGAAYVGRALARYHEAVVGALKGGRAPSVDFKECIADLEKAQRIHPSSPFVNVALLRLYELAKQPAERLAQAKAIEGQPIGDAAVKLAVARVWVEAGDGDRALKQVSAVQPESLHERLGVARIRIAAHHARGDAASAGRALRELLEGAADDRPTLMDALAGHEGLAAAVEAAVREAPKVGALQELRLRTADASAFAGAFEGFVTAVDDPGALGRAARLALGRKEDPLPGRAAAEALSRKAPDSPHASALLGLILLKAGERDAAVRRFDAVLEGLEKEALVAEHVVARAEMLPAIAQAYAEADREEGLVRTCRLFVGCLNRTARPYRLAQGDNKDPVGVAVTHLVARGRHVQAFQALKDLDREKFMYLHNLRHAFRAKGEEFARAVREDLLMSSQDPADWRKFATLLTMAVSRPQEAAGAYEKAYELAPDNPEVGYELANACQGSDPARALQVYEEVVARLGKATHPKLDRNAVLFQVASLHRRASRFEQAAAALDRMNLEAATATWLLDQVGAIYEAAGAEDKALAAYGRFVERVSEPLRLAGSDVFSKLGRLREKRGDFEAAYRAYSKGVQVEEAVKSRSGMSASIRGVPRPGMPQPELQDSASLRAALLKKLGQDWFIDRFLKGTLPPLAAADRAAVKDLLEKLGSDSVVDRDGAEGDLKKLGPGCAPLLKGALGAGGDEEFKVRARQLLWSWSEPR